MLPPIPTAGQTGSCILYHKIINNSTAFTHKRTSGTVVPLRGPSVQLHTNRKNTGEKRQEHLQGAWHDAQKDTKKAACRPVGQAAIVDLA